MPQTFFADHALARRLERVEMESNRAFAETRARLEPQSGAGWQEFGGAYAVFDGPESPLTQMFGFGLFQTPEERHLDAVEAWYAERGAPVFLEVSPLAGPGVLPLLGSRGYRPVELTNVLCLVLSEYQGAARPGGVDVRLAAEGDREAWVRTGAEGWREFPKYKPFMTSLLNISFDTGCSFLAEIDGIPVAAGGMLSHGGVALLAGASTIPEYRRRGAQNALLDARLRFAMAHGGDLAMLCAVPGSASQRNAERHGFRVCYTRIKWGLR